MQLISDQPVGDTRSQEHNAVPAEPTCAPDTANRERLHSRRALVAGLVGAGAGAAAAVVVGAQPASADTGGSLILGEPNTALSTTSVSTTGGTGLEGLTSDGELAGSSGVTGIDQSDAGAIGVQAISVNGSGYG